MRWRRRIRAYLCPSAANLQCAVVERYLSELLLSRPGYQEYVVSTRGGPAAAAVTSIASTICTFLPCHSFALWRGIAAMTGALLRNSPTARVRWAPPLPPAPDQTPARRNRAGDRSASRRRGPPRGNTGAAACAALQPKRELPDSCWCR